MTLASTYRKARTQAAAAIATAPRPMIALIACHLEAFAALAAVHRGSADDRVATGFRPGHEAAAGARPVPIPARPPRRVSA